MNNLLDTIRAYVNAKGDAEWPQDPTTKQAAKERANGLWLEITNALQRQPDEVTLLPVWSYIWTPKQAEKNLPDFIFKGPGIYEYKNLHLIVLSVYRTKDSTWHQKFKDYERFEFNAYHHNAADTLFNLIVNAPMRT